MSGCKQGSCQAIGYSYFGGLTQPIGEWRVVALDDFLKGWTKQRRVAVKNKAGLFNATRFQEGKHRGTKTAIETHAIILDVDNSNEGSQPVTIKAMISALEGAGVMAFLATSFSHTPAKPRFRVMIPLETPVPAENWKEFATSAIRHLGLDRFERGLDMPALRDVAKVYFLPSAPSDGEVKSKIIEGRVLDPKDVIISPDVKKRTATHSKKAIESGEVQEGVYSRYKGDLRTLDLLALLKKHGIEPNKTASGYYRLRCPWKNEEDDSDKSRAAWFIHSPGRLPVFKCWHASCEKRSLVQLLELFDPEVVDTYCKEKYDQNKPYDIFHTGKSLILNDFDIQSVVDQCVQVIAESGLVFSRGSVLVDVPGFMEYMRDPTGRQNIGSTTYRLREIPVDRVNELLSAEAVFCDTKMDKESGKLRYVRTAVNSSVLKSLMARGYYPISSLEGVTSIPVMTRGGDFLTTPGYDPESKLIYLPNHGELAIPSNPTLEDARNAVARLLDLVSDFPFASEVDKAAWLAGLLTLFARHAITGPTPFFLAMANIRSSGKTLLIDLIGRIVLGKSTPRLPHTQDQKEESSQLFSIALKGDQLVLLDNIDGKVGSSSFNCMLTSTSIQGRILYTQQMQSVPMLAVWFGTANNPSLHPDLARRMVAIRLMSKDERPELRTEFKYNDLNSYVESNRESILVDCLTALKAFILAKPTRSFKNSIGSYESWDRVIREAVFWITGIDPCERTVKGDCEHDSERNSLEVIVNTWLDVFQDQGKYYMFEFANYLVEDEEKYAGIFEAIRELSPKCDGDALKQPKLTQTLGYLLRRYKDRPILGYRFVSSGGRDRNGTLWSLVSLCEKKKVDLGSSGRRFWETPDEVLAAEIPDDDDFPLDPEEEMRIDREVMMEFAGPEKYRAFLNGFPDDDD